MRTELPPSLLKMVVEGVEVEINHPAPLLNTPNLVLRCQGWAYFFCEKVGFHRGRLFMAPLQVKIPNVFSIPTQYAQH